MKKTLLAPTLCTFLLAFQAAAMAQPRAATQDFERAYFLQMHQKDLVGAAEAYEKVVADTAADARLRAEAELRLRQCREDLASADFARLMPPDTLAYLEIVDPGKHIAALAGMLGLDSTPPNGAAATDGTPLGEGFFLPDDVSISPALLAELNKIKGAAAAVTAILPDGSPQGIAVLHPGDCDLLRGLLESAVQVIKPAAAIGGFKTYQVENEVWITATTRLLLVSRSREQLEAAVQRLNDPQADNLAGQAEFRETDRDGALAFVYVNGARAMMVAGPQLRGEEAAVARALLDLERLESLTAVLRTNQQGIELEVALAMGDDHRNLLYSLVRTAPLTRATLGHVPSGAVAVAVLGLNPQAQPAIGPADGGHAQPSAMDVGRELFSNIQEIALFVLPPSGQTSARNQIPEIAAVIASNDTLRSEALWNQLLSLPALLGPTVAQPPAEIMVDGQAGRQYTFRDAPPIALVRVSDRAVVAGTLGAVEAAVNAGDTDQTIAADQRFQAALDQLGPDTSKAVFVNGGRALEMAAAGGPPELMQMSPYAKDLTLLVVTQESPARLVLRGSISGLPRVAELLKAFRASEGRAVGPRRARAAAPAATSATPQ
ncbi:MAG: hypothetical protein WD847_13895 [Pirellulales bacterium]